MSNSVGIAAWSIRHPVGTCMIALAIIVLGAFSLGKLSIDLLPHIIYPEIRVRILDPGVTASVMEEKVTRQLEEQLAITDGAIQVQSNTSTGNTSVDLSFEYGSDVDTALREASTRLDRAKRFLPTSINPPEIFKFDPSQIPVVEFVVTSRLANTQEIKEWADNRLRKWFLNLPGVAAVEVGGGQDREIHVLPDQERLAAVGLTLADIREAIRSENLNEPTGRILSAGKELPGQLTSRFENLAALENLILTSSRASVNPPPIYLHEVASIIDTTSDERIKIRANGISGVKVSIQKQPSANTVDIVNHVLNRLQWLSEQQFLPEGLELIPVSDQSIYIKQSLSHSTQAAISGALLAMAVVYLFLGNLRRTLIIGSAIPIAVMVTFTLMGMANLTLNIMTLGGLALGVGMLVDNAIVMMENIYRHQRVGENAQAAAESASAEVTSALVASTTTNLAAVLPFLFVSGLSGLIFRELILTISAAILASLIIAMTLVPALAAKVGGVLSSKRNRSPIRQRIDSLTDRAQSAYASVLSRIFRFRLLIVLIFLAGLAWSATFLSAQKSLFLPKLDDGQITIRITGDPGAPVNELDEQVSKLEALFSEDTETEMVYSLVGGSVFGRSQRETSNQASMIVQLLPLSQRSLSSGQWITNMQAQISSLQLPGIRVRMLQRGIRGLRTGASEEDFSIRIQGDDLDLLKDAANQLVTLLRSIPQLSNVSHSMEEESTEVHFELDKKRLSGTGLTISDVSTTLSVALEGQTISTYLENDREYDILLRLPKSGFDTLEGLESTLLFPKDGSQAIRLSEVAQMELYRAPMSILRDNQMRIVEITATLQEGASISALQQEIDRKTELLTLPAGFSLYDGGSRAMQKDATDTASVLLALALFLVFVVMAVQYEALMNPFVILLSIPFSLIGVALGLQVQDLPLSMPVWLGLIMLAGIVVNNAIVLVEYIEQLRKRGINKRKAIIEAGRLRLRPILMTTLTTVIGMLPLASGTGEGAEMLQPLAVCIVAGLSFSTLVSLILVPLMYDLLHPVESEHLSTNNPE